jgi:hypothetical protein
MQRTRPAETKEASDGKAKYPGRDAPLFWNVLYSGKIASGWSNNERG